MENIVREFPTLYALSKTGAIRVYNIVVTINNENKTATITTTKQSKIGGKETIDTYVFDKGVNIGKANETTYLEQALLEAESRFRKQKDLGYSEEMPSDDTVYNTDASGNMKPMLAISYDETKIQFPCVCQPKYDGVRCLTFEDENGEIHLLSRKGKEYIIPHIKQWANEHKYLLPLDGELYNHKELTFQEIVSAVKKESETTSRLSYVVYDIPVENMKFASMTTFPYTCSDYETDCTIVYPGPNRLNRLCLINELPDKGPIKISEYRICNSFDDIKHYHDECVEDGYEGIIIRNSDGIYEFGFKSSNLIKYKEFVDDEFDIIDVVEATGRDAGTAVFVCVTKDGKKFNVKPKGDKKLRSEYFSNREKYINKKLTVKYQGLSDDGIPRFPSGIAIRDYE